MTSRRVRGRSERQWTWGGRHRSVGGALLGCLAVAVLAGLLLALAAAAAAVALTG